MKGSAWRHKMNSLIHYNSYSRPRWNASLKERASLAIKKCEKERKEVTGDAILSYFPPPSVKDIKGQFFYRTHANYYWNQWLEKQVGITFTEAEFASEKEKRNAKMALERFEHFS